MERRVLLVAQRLSESGLLHFRRRLKVLKDRLDITKKETRLSETRTYPKKFLQHLKKKVDVDILSYSIQRLLCSTGGSDSSAGEEMRTVFWRSLLRLLAKTPPSASETGPRRTS